MTVGYSITIESWKVILEDGLNKQHMDGCVGNVHKYHDPGHKAVTSPLKDVEEERDKGRAQNNAESPAFNHVHKVEGWCSFIETMLLLKYEGLI